MYSIVAVGANYDIKNWPLATCKELLAESADDVEIFR
jgi:hypothetical protein